MDGPFAHLVREYGFKAAEHQARAQQPTTLLDRPADEDHEDEKEGAALMLDEERETGKMPLSVYGYLLKSMGSPLIVGVLALGLVFSQGTQVAHTLWLGFWQSDEFPNLSQAAYQGVYAGIAVIFALAAFASNAACVALVIRASMRMCNLAMERIMSSPTAFLDRTPVGLVGLRYVGAMLIIRPEELSADSRMVSESAGARS